MYQSGIIKILQRTKFKTTRIGKAALVSKSNVVPGCVRLTTLIKRSKISKASSFEQTKNNARSFTIYDKSNRDESSGISDDTLYISITLK